MSKLMATVLTLGALATAVMPAHAQESNSVTIQNARSESSITGIGNGSWQTIDQSVWQGSLGQPPNNTGIVQTADQFGGIYGEGNYSGQSTVQTVDQLSLPPVHDGYWLR